MITYYTADYILPVRVPAIKDGIVAIDEQGVVQGVFAAADPRVKTENMVKLDGILIPGFVNAHCHLELSHMHGKIPRGEGLIRFLQQVISGRAASEETVIQAMEEADKAMFARGIQVVGDHVNTRISAGVKARSPIYYHTFVELMGMSDEGIQERVDEARDIEYDFEPRPTSITPHAPYSCSRQLLKAMGTKVDSDNIFSIHNQESEAENKLFRYKSGEFLDFYTQNNIDYTGLRAQGKNSLQSCVPLLPEENPLILVHNTYTSVRDIYFLRRIGRKVYYCLCPKANLYIEGQLPHINNFVLSQQKVLIGTDSLASNDTLDILDELKTILTANPELTLESTIAWATLNGAEALGVAGQFGSLESGKQPGLVLLEHTEGLNITLETQARRIV